MSVTLTNPDHLTETHRSHLRFLLNTVTEIFHRHRLTYWLDRGTLLGAYRSESLILGDSDIDLRVIHDQWLDMYTALKNELPSGLTVHARHHASLVNEPSEEFSSRWFENEHGRYPIELQEGYYRGVYHHSPSALVVCFSDADCWSENPNLDLYCCRVNRHIDCTPKELPAPWMIDKRKYLCTASDKPDSIIPYEYVFPLVEKKFEDACFRVPGQLEFYLRHIFGYLEEDAIYNDETGLWEKNVTGKAVYES